MIVKITPQNTVSTHGLTLTVHKGWNILAFIMLVNIGPERVDQ